MADSTSEPASILDLIEHANRLRGLRADIVRSVNELFATIADVAENEQEGKYGALVELTARMQDQRDEALDRVRELEGKLAAARDSANETHREASSAEAALTEMRSATVNALTIRNAAVEMRNALDDWRMKAVATSADARAGARAHELVVQFDERTADMIRPRQEGVE